MVNGYNISYNVEIKLDYKKSSLRLLFIYIACCT